jgi:hypothetical protein
MSKYQELISELCGDLDEHDVLAKSDAGNEEPEDDEEDRDGDGDGVEDEGSEVVGDDDDDEGDDDEEDLGKSLSVTLENGETIEAVDGTDLVKSLIDRIETNETATTDALQKAVKVISGQSQMIKSLKADVAKLGNRGRGRRTVVNVHDKPDLTKSHAADEGPAPMTPNEVMAKAMTGQKEGRLTGTDIAVAEAHLNRGSQIPEHLLARILNQ